LDELFNLRGKAENSFKIITDKMFTCLDARLLKLIPFFSIAFLLFTASCTATRQQQGPRSDKAPGFMDQLALLKGKKVAGTVVYPYGQDAPFKGERIWLEINGKGQKEVRLPIYRDQQVYRTLILGQDEQGMFLQHENKKPNGQQAEISMYGGHRTGAPSPYLMVFPADAYSKQLLGSYREHVWSLAFNNDRTILSYITEENGHVTLQIDFDVSAELEKTLPGVESTIDMPKNVLKKQPALALLRQQ
jgi:hypothetical protein